MGKVWVAYHHRLKTRVAVKFVHDKVTGDNIAEAIKRFEHEASTAAQIKSPHVVQVFDSGLSTEGEPYIVMELLEGQSLGDRIRLGGTVGWSDGAIIIAQVARALTKAHELGIVHRDIKPDNIFLCRADDGVNCKVLDFGIAKQTRLPAMGGLTTDGKIVGTPEFMSPELVLDDRAVDYRADLWALAVVMYVAITGQLPFSGKTLGQLCLNLVNTTPQPPSRLRKDLPPGADAWFAQALHRHANERYSSAREMAVSFAAVLGGGAARSDLASPTLTLDIDTERQFAASADPPTVPTLIRRRRITRPLKAALAAAGVAIVTLAVVVLGGSSEVPRAVQSQAAERAFEVASQMVGAEPSDEPAAKEAPAAATVSPIAAPMDHPRSTPAVAAAGAAASAKSKAAPAAKQAPGAKEAPAASGKRRGKDVLGF